jgi:hypothetical protein
MQIPIAIVVLGAAVFAGVLLAPTSGLKRIDCEQVEFHPDYTAEMKEQCRMMRSGKMT